MSPSNAAPAKGDKALLGEVAALERAEATLSDGVPLYRADLSDADREALAPSFLLTNKPALVVVNIGTDQLATADALAAPFGEDALAVCIELEGDPDVVASEGDERGVAARRPRRPRERRASARPRRRCTCSGGAPSSPLATRSRAPGRSAPAPRRPSAPGVIHSDLQRGFIRAEVIDWRDLLEIGSWTKAKDLGKLRVEGKDYVVADGDVLEIRFNV